MSDGPNGVRGSRFDERISAWCVPCGTALAATWDDELVRKVGVLLGDEARRMDIDVLLGPMVNLHRSPLGGRGFESYSEDPLLSGRMAAAWIRGVQSRGVAASPKHFVGNDSESSRTTVNCVIDERALRELYLVPFEHAVRAGAWSLMASYNRVNGIHVTEHRALLRTLLKEEWDWDGLVMSDWGAAHDTVRCAQAGLDLAMPVGPVLGASLGEAVNSGVVAESELDDKVTRLTRLAARITDSRGRLPPVSGAGSAAEVAEQRALVTRAAAGGFVLLKNDIGLLPMQLDVDGGALAVVGPNASEPCIQGGGSSWVNSGDVSTPLAVVLERYRDVVEVHHERGCASHALTRPLQRLGIYTTGEAKEVGLTLTYVADSDGETTAVSEVRQNSFLSWHDGITAFATDRSGYVQMSTWLTPDRSGEHLLSVRGSGATSVSVNGFEVAALPPQAVEGDIYAAFYSQGVGEGTIRLAAKVPVLVEAKMRHLPGGIPVFEVGCQPPEPADLLERAVSVAKAAQAVVLVVGTNADVEAESVDRETTALPGDQDSLVAAVLAANPRTIVVVNAGAAVDMPWIDQASTVVYSWFGGHGFADALGAVLAGELEPGGRLPITLAADSAHYPAYDTLPDADGRLVYSESVFVGYRHLDARGLRPAFPFGHGLSYTKFEYGPVRLSAKKVNRTESLAVSLTIRNVGERPGKEVVQLYVSPPPGGVPRPPRELKGFAAAHLDVGEARLVTLNLDARAFAHWDSRSHSWQVRPGDYAIHVGRSSQDLRRTATVQVDV